MRKIRKTHCSQLTTWRQTNREINHTYEDLKGTDAFHHLKDKLLSEQGFICAYTGKRISKEASHCEHIKPQNLCEEWEDVDYRNLVACFPSSGGDKSYGYGAPIKSFWWDENLFISPLNDICLRCYKFTWSGSIECNNAIYKDQVNKTIAVLGLNKSILREERRRVIKGFFRWTNKPRVRQLSIEEARTHLSEIQNFDGRTKLPEFSFALEQLLEKFIANNGQRI